MFKRKRYIFIWSNDERDFGIVSNLIGVWNLILKRTRKTEITINYNGFLIFQRIFFHLQNTSYWEYLFQLVIKKTLKPILFRNKRKYFTLRQRKDKLFFRLIWLFLPFNLTRSLVPTNSTLRLPLPHTTEHHFYSAKQKLRKWIPVGNKTATPPVNISPDLAPPTQGWIKFSTSSGEHHYPPSRCVLALE